MTNLHWSRDLINPFSHAQGGTVTMVALVPLHTPFLGKSFSAQCCHAMNEEALQRLDAGHDRNRVVGCRTGALDFVGATLCE